jgi:hypothetical protein
MDESPESKKPTSQNTNSTPIDLVSDTEKSPGNKATGNKKDKSKYDKINNIIAGFAVLISIIAAGFGYWQIDIAKDTAKRQLRAYLGIQPVCFYNHDISTGKSFLNYAIINYGQTPAKKVHSIGNLKILDFPMKEDVIPDYSSSEKPRQSGTIFPREESAYTGSVEIDSVLSNQTLEEVNSSKSERKIYAFISISYVDIFNIERHTTYCACLFGLKNAKGDSISRWAHADRFNDFD